MLEMKKIRALLLVQAANFFVGGTLAPYRECAGKIGRMLLKNPALAQHVLLCVTRLDPRVSQEYIKKRLEQLWVSEKLAEVSEEGAVELHDKRPLKYVTRMLLKEEWRIVMMDVTNPLSREHLFAVLADLRPTDESEFDFANYHELVARWVLGIKKIKDKKERYQQILEEQQKIYDTQQQQLKFWSDSESILAGEATIDQRMQTCLQKRRQLELYLEKIINCQEELRQQQAVIAAEWMCACRQKEIIQAAAHSEVLLESNAILLSCWQDFSARNKEELTNLEDLLKAGQEELDVVKSQQKTLTKEKKTILGARAIVDKKTAAQVESVLQSSQEAKLGMENAAQILRVNAEFFASVEELEIRMGSARRANVVTAEVRRVSPHCH